VKPDKNYRMSRRNKIMLSGINDVRLRNTMKKIIIEADLRFAEAKKINHIKPQKELTNA